MALLTSVFDLLDDERICEKIRQRLPYLFTLAELEASRAGRVGMEVGTLREQILIALLIYKFGKENVSLDIPITEPEVDVLVFNRPLSIKTVTAKQSTIPAVKVVWTVDWQKVEEFVKGYFPRSDILLVIVRWGLEGGFYLIPQDVQREVLERMGKENYLHIPRRGTNPRGVEIASKAVRQLIAHSETKAITIKWHRPENILKGERQLSPYERWLHYWQSEE
ncbi:MAG: ThaI family type II restriction endonuclease [Armatimonadetes bacterium]|nr:ThaI family type II restriction endonuclease [Armatimonadota bacterium]